MVWTLALFTPALAAAAATTLASRRQRPTVGALAIGLAFGASSITWGALFFAGVRPRALLLAVETVIWLAVAVALVMVRRQWPMPPSSPWSKARVPGLVTIAAVALLIATASVAVASFLSASAVFPHGEWDAWAQWNLRARFFFRGFETGEWRQAFAPVLVWSHPDYPPLVPLSVARLWLYLGRDTTAAPIAFAALIASSIVASAGFGTARIRDAARGCLAAASILACPSFVRYAAAQCADIPLALYMLAAFVLWSMADEHRGRLWLGLAGLSAALAAWTKNEGIPFLALFITLVTVERVRRFGAAGWRDTALVAAGAAPVVILEVFFKRALAPPSYFVADQSFQQAMGHLFDAARIRLVVESVAKEAWLTGATRLGVLPFLALYLIGRGIDRQAPLAAKAAAPAMAVMLAIYTLAYLVTPMDVAWQLKTSLDRLLVQLVPTLAWSVVTMSK